ncbi:MAG: hypothetical protein Q4A83_07015, partial [Bacillota bacterium]|nr:hypothetical protein [Bacillota bacterium]
MKKTRRGLSFLLCLVMVLSLLAGMPIIPNVDLGTEAEAVSSNTNPGGTSQWVTAWHTSMVYLDSQSDSSTAVGVIAGLNERTLRTTIPMSQGGNTIRLTYSNEYGTGSEWLKIGEITLAKGNAKDAGEWANSTYVAIKGNDLAKYFKTAIANGQAVMGGSYYNDSGILKVKPGQKITSDPIDISKLGIKANDYMCVSTWVCDMNSNSTGFKKGFTGGLIGGDTKYLGIALNGTYNHTEEQRLGQGGVVSPVSLSKSNETGDYNVIPFLNTVEVQRSNANQYTTVIMGDSTLANDIPVKLASRLDANDIDDVAFVWAAVKGNELLLNGQDGAQDHNGNAMDEAAISVIDEVLQLNGVKKVIVKVGINDILHPNCSDMTSNFAGRSAAQVTEQIIAGYKYLVQKCHEAGVEIYFYELTPWRADDGTVYTRAVGDAGNTLSYSDSIDQIRRNVNAWLATYGDAYDNMTPGQDDSYSGSITIGDEYGNGGYKKAYATKSVTVNHDNFDRFGYISLEGLGTSNTGSYAMGSASCGDKTYSFSTAMAKGFTTDGIHYTQGGQTRVSGLTPLSIFYKQETLQSQDGNNVIVRGVYFTTTTLNDGNNYFIVNTNGAGIKNDFANANQSTTGYAVGNSKDGGYETTLGGLIGTDISANTINTRSHVSEKVVEVQRGTSGKAYVVENSANSDAKWSLSKVDGSYYWSNDGYYLSFNRTRTTTGDSIYSTSTPTFAGSDSSSIIGGIFGGSKGWFTFNKTSPQGDDMVRLYYDADGTDKELVLADKKMGNYGPQFITVAQYNGNHIGDYRTSRNVALFDSTSKGVYTELDIAQDTSKNWLEADDNTVLLNKTSTDSIQLYFQLNSDMLDQYDQHTSSFSYIDRNADDGYINDARGPYPLYTFGDNQKIYWMSSNTDVATVTQSDGLGTTGYDFTQGGGLLEFTGNLGTTTVTANFFWKEYDGKNYEFDCNNGSYYSAPDNRAVAEGYRWVQVNNYAWVYTNYNWLTSDTVITNAASFDADILINGEAIDSTTINDVVNGNDTTLQAIGISDPVNLDFLPDDGHWVWSFTGNTGIMASNTKWASDKNDDTVSIVWNGTEGTVTATATYYKADGTQYKTPDNKSITSSVSITIKAKEPKIDIFLADNSNPDLYEIPGAIPGDTLALNAKVVDSQGVAYTTTAWTWRVLADASGTASDVFTQAPSGANNTLTVAKNGGALVLVDMTYTQGGAAKHAYSFIWVDAECGTTTSNTIIDFGLPVQLNLRALCSANAVDGISKTAPKVAEKTAKASSADSNYTASINDDLYTATLADSVMTYTPTGISDGAKDTIYYQANFGDFYKYDHVDVIPATSIYYEDSFVTFDGDWKQAGEDAPRFQLGNDDVFGYDEAYGQFETFSMGGAKCVTVNDEYGANVPTNSTFPTAKFTFTGTGFAVYSVSSSEAGYVSVKYKNLDTGKTSKFSVNAYAVNGKDTYLQTPTVQKLGLDYGRYEVTLTVVYDSSFDGNANNSYSYYVDAVRIYSPMGADAEAQAVYAQSNEANATFETVRSLLISKDTFGTLKDGSTAGAVFLDNTKLNVYDEDGNVTEWTFSGAVVDDYKNYGPKNEVYLSKGQGVAFKIENVADLKDVQLGIKLANGTSGKVTINDTEYTITSATDMYYSIMKEIDDNGNVVIVNSGDSLISITVLKTTSAVVAEAPARARIMASSAVADFGIQRIAMCMAPPADPEPTDPVVEPTDEPEPTDE